MSDHLFDLDDNDFIYKIDDDYALGSDGHIVQNAGGGMGMDLNTGEFHMTSGWDSSDTDDESEEESFLRKAYNSSSVRSSTYKTQSRNTSPTYTASNSSKNTGLNGNIGCASVFFGLIAAVAVGVELGIEGDHPFTYVMWAVFAVIIGAALVAKNKAKDGGPKVSGTRNTYVPTTPVADEISYRYCRVIFHPGGFEYAYRTTDYSIRPGEYVLVPTSTSEELQPAKVTEVHDYPRSQVPYPLEDTKFISKKIDAGTYDSLRKKNESSEDPNDTQRRVYASILAKQIQTLSDRNAVEQLEAAQTMEVPILKDEKEVDDSANEINEPEVIDPPKVEKNTVEELKPQKEEENENEVKVLRSRSRMLVVIVILLAVIAAMLGGLVFYLMQNPEAAENATSLFGRGGKETTVVSAPTKTPSPTRTPAPTPSPTPSPEPKRNMGDDETYDMILDVLDRLNAPSAYLGDYNERIWLPDSVAMDVEDIQEEERIWAGHRDDLQVILDDMDSVTPSATFKKSWEDLYAYTSHLAAAAAYLSDWDTNDDGVYSNEEDTDANQNALDIALLGQTDMEELETDFAAALAEYEAKLSATPTPRPTARPTPRPTPTPKRTTPKTTTNSDPFNTGDYAHPDDFYYDYYDDFWDYEDAEEYWEEWN